MIVEIACLYTNCAVPSRRSKTQKLSNHVITPCSLTPFTKNTVTENRGNIGDGLICYVTEEEIQNTKQAMCSQTVQLDFLAMLASEIRREGEGGGDLVLEGAYNARREGEKECYAKDVEFIYFN